MKAFIISLLSVVLLASTSFAQNKPVKQNFNKKSPEITFEKIEYDFGTIPYGSDATCEFVYKNTGKLPLILTKVRSSCGCTIPSWPKTPIKKKKKGKVTVKYNTHRIGKFHKTITVISNAKNSPIVLTITGKVDSVKNIKKPKVTNSTLNSKPIKH